MILDSESVKDNGPHNFWEGDLPPVHTFIMIDEYEKATYEHPLSEAKFLVKHYVAYKDMQFIPMPHLYTDEQGREVTANVDPTKEIVCVVESTEDALYIVGPSYRKSSPALPHLCHGGEGEMFMATQLKSKHFFRLEVRFGSVCLIKDYSEEREFNRKKAARKVSKNDKNRAMEEGNHQQGKDAVMMYPPKGDGFITSLRILTEEEKQDILDMCRSKEHVTLQDALLYMRDPRVNVLRREELRKTKEAENHTVDVKGGFYLDKDRLMFSVYLDKKQTKLCTQSQSQCAWQLGSFLKVRHKGFCREFTDS